jgi:hypothetical protein
VLKRAKARIELDIDVDPEFYDYIFENAHTELEFCESRGKLVLYTEYEMDLPLIQKDIEKILRLVERVNEVYKTVGYPWEALEILEKERGVLVG